MCKKAGLVLRGARYRENMSQTELAKKSGVHQNEISKIENGKRTALDTALRGLEKLLHDLFDSLNKSYLTHTQSAKQLLAAR